MKFAVFALGFLLLLLLILLPCAVFYIFNQLTRREQPTVPEFITRMIGGNKQPDYEYIAHLKERAAWLESHVDEQLYITNCKGERLRGQLMPAEEPSEVFILMCHGCRSSGTQEYACISEALHNHGYNLLIIDHVASGESEGKYIGYGVLESRDTMLWIDYLNNRFGRNIEILLYGISMGAATVLMMGGKALPENVRGIIADCPYTSAWNEFAYQLKSSFHLPEWPLLPLISSVCRLRAGYTYKEASPAKALKSATLPILFIHGGADDFVPTYMSREMYLSYAGEKQIEIFDDAIHARSYQTYPEEYERVFCNFVDAHTNGGK